MVKSQLKYFKMFQYDYKVYVKISSILDIEQLRYKGTAILFYTIDEIE